MKMSGADTKKYPRFAYYVRNDLSQVILVPSIVSALNKVGQINKVKLMQALRWGFGPLIKVTALVGAYGEFTPGVRSNEIRIDQKVVSDFEAGRGVRAAHAGRVYLVGVTLLHELVHWGDDQDGVDRAGEEGEELERRLYGKVIN